MHFLSAYSLFFAKTLTIVIALIVVFAAILALISKGKGKAKERLVIKKLNEKFKSFSEDLRTEVMEKSELKKLLKQEKKQNKLKNKNDQAKKRIFVINFVGDIKASAVHHLREEVTAILTVAKPADEVVVRLESSGGMVHGYGLAASQLKRLRDKNIFLTVTVDKVAASGGYLMACVANRILAAPFAIIGSIGVIAQLPNLHRYLKNKDIDFEQVMAGEYKRTISLFGKITDKGREKLQEEVEAIHHLFKSFIAENRNWINIEKVATGEYWQALDALKLQLVDELKTSDDYLLAASYSTDIYEVSYQTKKSFAERLSSSVQLCADRLLSTLTHRQLYW